MTTEVNQEPGKDEAPAGSSSSAPHDSNQSTAGSVPGAERPHQPGLSARVKGLHAKYPQLRSLFEGTRKKNGKRLEGSSEYDRAYVEKLAQYGVDDGNEIAEAVMARPDGHALRRGQRYALELAEDELGTVRAAEAERVAGKQDRFAEARRHTDIVVDEVRIIESDATRYELSIKGKWLILTARQLTNMKEFEEAYLNLFHERPELPPPTGKNARRLWRDLVNSWLAVAHKELLVGNATDEQVLSRAVEKAKKAIPTADDPARLHDDMAYEGNGRRYFTADAIYDRVKQLDRNFKHRDLARILTALGCDFDSAFAEAGDHPLPVWSEPLTTPPTGGGAKQSPPTTADDSVERGDKTEVLP